MTSQHLTDETLQAVLLKETLDENLSSHLMSCAACKEKLESYQHLVKTFQKIEPEKFTFDVSSLVMQRIVQFEKQESRNQKFVFWGLLSLLLLLLVWVGIPFIPQMVTTLNSIPIFKTLLIVGTGLFAAFFLLTDLYRQFKLKERKIFENILQPIF